MANRTFCSASCRDEFRRNNLGADNPHYTQIEIACGVCGALFHTRPARLKGRNVYCSTPCAKEGRRRSIAGRAVLTRHSGKRRAKIRDGFACRICGFDLFVHAHHIAHKANGGTNKLDNLISLCPNHHAMAHAGLLAAEEMLAALAQALPHAQELRLRAKHAIHYRPIKKASVLS